MSHSVEPEIDTTVQSPLGADPNELHFRSRAARSRTLTVAILTTAALLTIYLLRLDAVVGQFKDDGWYVILAQSLAMGRGFNLINLPGHSWQYFYPPLFPFLLSLLYRVSPEFPGNLPLLKSLSICSLLVLPIFVFRLFHGTGRLPRSLAYLVAVAGAVAPAAVMLATSSVMSESVFTTLQFAALLFAERWSRKQQGDSQLGIVGIAAIAVACYLTRAIGIVLVAAIAVDILRRRRLRSLALFLAVVVMGIAPWTIYKHLALKDAGSREVVGGYSSQFWDRLAGASRGKVSIRDLPGRFWQTSTVLLGDDIGGILAPSFYRTASESGEELTEMTAVIPAIARNAIGMHGGSMGLPVAAQFISLGLAILVLLGFVTSLKHNTGVPELAFGFSLVAIVAWPWSPIRFLVPLLPLLLYYLLKGSTVLHTATLIKLGKPATSEQWSAARVVMLCILILFVYDNIGYVIARHRPSDSFQHPDWLRRFNATVRAGQWIQEHTSPSEIVSGDNLPRTYLYARRETDVCGADGGIDECSTKGIRFYLQTSDTLLPSFAKPVFRSSQCIGVLKLGDVPQ